MKAERRHELKTNTLAHGLENLPELGRQYGTKILLAIVAVLTIIVFVRFQARSSREAKEQAAATYAGAVSGISNLGNVANMPDTRAAADQRRKIQDEATKAIQQVLDESKDPALRADALLARGDLNWQLATLPELRGADTQPSLKLAESDADLLDKARTAYEAAAKAEGVTPLTLTNARLSLAAVAEERGKWDEARQQYEQVIADARTPAAFKNEAKVRLEDLADISKPVLIGKPATKPASELPELGPPAPAISKPTSGPAATTTTTAPAEPEATPEEIPVEAGPAPAPSEPEASPSPKPSPAPTESGVPVSPPPAPVEGQPGGDDKPQ